MRKVLFCLIFLLAAFIPVSMHAGNAISTPGNKIALHDLSPHFYQTGTESILVNDILDNVTDDSNSNESDRKKPGFGKSIFPEIFHTGNSSDIGPIKTYSSGVFIVQKTSRYVLLNVFRL